jgi:hypothetical protein
VSKTWRVSNGDIYFDSRGRATWIKEREKCAQDLANVLLQDLYDDGRWGCQLARMEDSQIVDAESAHKAVIQTLVSEAVERLIVFQEEDEDIPDLEKLDDFTVIVERIVQQSLSYIYFLSAETVGSDEPVEQTFTVDLEHVRDPNLINIDPFGVS